MDFEADEESCGLGDVWKWEDDCELMLEEIRKAGSTRPL